MTADIQYLTDENGKRTSVLLPIEDWERLKGNEAMKEMQQVVRDIRDGLAEIAESKRGGVPLMSFEDFIRELRD